MPDSETWTVGRLLNWTTDYLKQRGVENPRLDAEILLAEARGCERIALYTDFDVEAKDAVRDRFRGLVQMRSEGKPVAYLVGHREFYSLDFRVTPDVLIPRPETEFLVMSMIDAAKSLAGTTPIEVADVGTGSGIIAVCAAKHVAGCSVTAIDVSEAALDVARGNASKHGVADHIDFITSDLLDDIGRDKRFHIIASNPPYVSEEEYETLPRNVRDFEPRIALTAGTQGTDVIARLIPQAAGRLYDGGWLFVEISPQIEEIVRDIVADNDLLESQPTVKDLAGLARVIIARRTP